MGLREKSITEINEKIKHGEAVVLTEGELLEEAQRGNNLNLSDVDVVTIGRQVPASGSASMLCVPVAGRGEFTRAEKIWINGIPGFPGPAPNERLGLVDTQIFAYQTVEGSQKNYSGARLFSDIISRKEIHVECLSMEGGTYRNSFTLDDLQFARLYVYNCLFEESDVDSKIGNRGRYLLTIRQGSKILLNGAPGIVIGCGTRSTPERKTLSMAADMFEMDPGGVRESDTDKGVIITNSIAVGIPALSEGILEDLTESLMEKKLKRVENGVRESEKETAKHLKQLIQKGDFLLVLSDMHLNNWN